MEGSPRNPLIARCVDRDTIIVIYTDPENDKTSRVEFPCDDTWRVIVDMFNLSEGR